MRIIHTADWHMGKRLGAVDRDADIARAIGRVADVCRAEAADVLLVCGDLFDGSTRADLVRQWTGVLTEAFGNFLVGGGTVVALTGNHDNENLAQTLRHSFALADPATAKPGGLLRAGRFHLFAGPTFFRLADRRLPSHEVQFVVMPSPTVARYGLGDQPVSPEDRDRTLKAAFRRTLDGMAARPGYDPTRQTVLAAHILTQGAELRPGTIATAIDAGGVVLAEAELPTTYAYVALGDVHRPQALLGLPHVRYSGSIDRMDLGESADDKSVVVVEVGPGGRTADPRLVPLAATPVYQVQIDDPPTQVPALTATYPDHATALVKLVVRYRAGRDNLLDLRAACDEAFPRCYDRDYQEETSAATTAAGPARPAGPARGMADTVRDYLAERLPDDDPDRAALLALAYDLLAELDRSAAR